VHAGEEGHARPGWTTSRRGQDSPWKSQSEWQRTGINGESTSKVWPTLGSRMAKDQIRSLGHTSLPLKWPLDWFICFCIRLTCVPKTDPCYTTLCATYVRKGRIYSRDRQMRVTWPGNALFQITARNTSLSVVRHVWCNTTVCTRRWRRKRKNRASGQCERFANLVMTCWILSLRDSAN